MTLSFGNIHAWLLIFSTEARKALERKKAKAEGRVQQREKSVSAANAKVKEALERRQKLRSAAFAAARKGDPEKVKKAVWEDSVDAAGSEALPGCEVASQADDKETLLHIAVECEDNDLIEWLVDHSTFLHIQFSRCIWLTWTV